MKKILGVVLAGALCLQGLPAAALADEAGKATALNFNQIKDEVLARNPLVASNWSKYSEGADGANDLESLLKQQESMLDASIAGIIQSYFSTQVLGKSAFSSRVSAQIAALPQPAQSSLTALLNSPVITGLADPVTALLSQDGSIIYGVATGKDASGSNMWLLVFPASPSVTLAIEPGQSESDPATVNLGPALASANLNLITLYEAQISSLEAQLKSIRTQQDNLWKSTLQIEQGNDQIAWGAQQLFLTVANLDLQLTTLQTQRDLLQRQLEAAQLQVQLGLSTAVEQKGIAAKLRDLDFSIKSLQENEDYLKGSLNVLLGQDYDTKIKLSNIAAPAPADLQKMDFDQDLPKALEQSFAVRLAANDTEREHQQRTVKAAFAQAFQTVQAKQEALALERAKLSDEEEKLGQAQLQYELGLLSTLAYEAAKLPYATQAAKVHAAEGDLLKAYTQYQWLLEGVNVVGAAASAAPALPAGQ